MSKNTTLLLASLLFAASEARGATRAGESLPNVVFFFADDLGWADVGRYHEHYANGTTQPIPAPVPTPNMNRLCDEGMMFTDAQLPAALCAPNRFCVLTGSNTYRSRPWGTWNRTSSTAFHYGNSENDRVGNPHRTAGGALQAAGYRTAYLGKMHLGGDFYDSSGTLLRDLPNNQLSQIAFTRKFDNGMLDHGFDYTFVVPDGIQGPVYAYFENDLYRPISTFAAEVDGVDASGASVLRSFTAGETVGNGEIIADGYGDSEFDTSEHGPILAHFACKFIEDHRTNHPDKPFMLYYAAPAIHVPHTPSVNGIEADGATGLGKRPDFIFDLDAQLGLLLDKLDALGVADNTIVIVSSDNGGFRDANGDGQQQIAAGQEPNGPLRASKGSIYEGGHRVPFIWRWGNGTAAGSVIPPGVVCNQLVSVIDWVPSMIDLTGGSVAADQHYDSVSLLPLLFAADPDAVAPVRTMHHFSLSANNEGGVRMDDTEGKWFFKRNFDGTGVELYNLATDLGQATNLTAGHDTVAAIPPGHPHKTRVEAMNAWYNAHNSYNEPRTTPAINYAPPAPSTGPRTISVNLTDFATDVQQIDSDETFGIAAEGSVVGGWVNLNRNNTATDLANDLGAATTVDLTLTAPNGWASFNAAYDDTPLKGGIDDYTGTANPTSLTLSGLNATFPDGCRVIVYLSGFNSNEGASITDGSTTYHFRTIGSPVAPVAPVTLVRTTDTTDDGSGTAPEAQYAVFGSEPSPLTADSITFTLDTIHGGGSAIGGVQVIGPADGGTSSKTAVPVPVPPPALSCQAHDLSLLAEGLEDDVSYDLQGTANPGAGWSVQATIPEGSGGSWTGSGTGSGDRWFYRLSYPSKRDRFVLPPPAP